MIDKELPPRGTSRLVPATIIARVAKAPVIFLSVGRETAKVSGLHIRLQVTSQSFPSTTTFTNFGFFRRSHIVATPLYHTATSADLFA
jgi:hypothetical protein